MQHRLVDQDAESSFDHRLLAPAEALVSRRRSLGRGALDCHTGDDGFLHARDYHKVPKAG